MTLPLALTLRRLRTTHGYTLIYVATHTHIAPSSLCAYEHGQYLPTLPNLCALADFYDVTTDALLGRCHGHDASYTRE